MNSKSLSNNEIKSIITYLQEDWGRNEIAFKVGCNSDVVSKINNGKYIVPQLVVESLSNYEQGMVIQNNESIERKGLIRSREAGPIIAIANTISNQKEKEQIIVFRSVTDLINTGVVPLSFKDNISNAAKGRKGGSNGHRYSNIEWYLLKEIVTNNSDDIPNEIIEIINSKRFDDVIFKPTINRFTKDDYIKTSTMNISLFDIVGALEISEEHLSLSIDYYKFAKIEEGRVKSVNHAYKKKDKNEAIKMFKIICISYDINASLYERNVIDLREVDEVFDSVKEAKEYINEYLVDDLKVEASQGEVSVNEIEVECIEDKNKVRLNAIYEGEYIQVYECWILEK